jgi:hypothetical protein
MADMQHTTGGICLNMSLMDKIVALHGMIFIDLMITYLTDYYCLPRRG